MTAVTGTVTQKQGACTVLPNRLSGWMELMCLQQQSGKTRTEKPCRRGNAHRHLLWVKESHHLPVGTSVTALEEEKKGWIGSRGSAHVKTEELFCLLL